MAGVEAAGSSLRRWRWRLRGAAMWPTFGGCVVADFVLMLALPPWGDEPSAVNAFLSAGSCNLVVVAVAAPLAGAALRRVRADLPRMVARDYAGTVLLLAVTLALLALGLAHRPVVTAADRSFRAQADAVRRYVSAHGGPAYRANAGQADTARLDSHMYRTCVPGADPARALCLFVDTSTSPPRVRPDTDQAPNWRYFNTRPPT